MKLRIGVDLGGTKIEVIALDEKGCTLARNRVSTPQKDYHSVISVISDIVFSIEKDLNCKGSLGVGIPGVISPTTGLVKNANLQCLIGKRFDKDLGKSLGREVRLCNDANCFSLSEAIDGAAKDYSVVFGVIIGTGTGGGIVINKQVLTGINAIAGEWGHNPLPWAKPDEIPGPDCYCGKKGCLETFLSGSGLSYDYFQATGDNLNPVDIVQKADLKNSKELDSLKRYIDRLARGLASIINVIDPDIIVLGGGLSNIKILYEEVPKSWKRYVFSDNVNTQLKQALHGDSSGVRGAAWLWPV